MLFMLKKLTIISIINRKILHSRNYFLSADKVLKLRSMLDKQYAIEGIMGDEKDPEEFLSSLLGPVMKAHPFIKLR